MRRRLRWCVLALVLAGGPLLGACSAGDGDEFEETGAETAAEDAGGSASGDESGGVETGGEEGGEDGGGGGTVALPQGQPISLERALVFTAQVALEVDDVQRTADRAVAIAETACGFAADDRREAGERPTADLVLRVPAPRYSEALRDVTALGEVVGQSASADDVTDQVVDLEGRIATARASVERLRGFLDRAATVADIASLEGELARREAELESLQGRLAVLDDQVQLSTITVSIDEPSAPTPSEDDDDATGFVRGLQEGWDALRALVGGTLVVVGALLPFAPIVLAGLVAWRFLDRRARARRVAAAAR